MAVESVAPVGSDPVSGFAGERLGLAGFSPDESSAIAKLLAPLGMMSCGISPAPALKTGELGFFSAVVMDIAAAPDGFPQALLATLPATTPLIALCSHEDLRTFPALEAGAGELVFKPWSGEELAVRVRRALVRTAWNRERVAARAPRVLIADDDAAIMGLTTGLLRNRGIECHCAKDGKTALEMARTLLPDLVILDVNMPLLGGLEILTSLREDPATAAMRILIFTGDNSPEAIATTTKLGVVGYLVKPFRPFDFLQRIKAFLPSLEPAPEAGSRRQEVHA